VSDIPFRTSDSPLTVLMNPPFGAQSGNEHADKAFLTAAAGIATVSYSVHNAGSAEFVESFASDHGGEVTHAFEAEFDLPLSFEFHTEESKAVDVEVFRIEW
jgi:putative methylase